MGRARNQQAATGSFAAVFGTQRGPATRTARRLAERQSEHEVLAIHFHGFQPYQSKNFTIHVLQDGGRAGDNDGSFPDLAIVCDRKGRPIALGDSRGRSWRIVGPRAMDMTSALGVEDKPLNRGDIASVKLFRDAFVELGFFTEHELLDHIGLSKTAAQLLAAMTDEPRRLSDIAQSVKIRGLRAGTQMLELQDKGLAEYAGKDVYPTQAGQYVRDYVVRAMR